MNKLLKLTLFFYLIINLINSSLSKENFFDEGLKLYKDKKYEDARFMFERSIVFNPKDAESYLFLAKIYKNEENEKEEIKNLNTTLLLDPRNEEAMHLLINYELKKSNYSKVRELKENFSSICKNLCKKLENIEKSLADIEPKNGS